MLKKRGVLLCVMTLLLLVFSSAQAANVLMEIGRSPFHKPPLTSTEELLAMLQSKDTEVRKGFELSGRSELFVPFMSQVTSAPIRTVEYQKGSWFEWMFYKRKGVGTVKVMKDVTWGNEVPFVGFEIDIEHEGSIHTFVIPLGCGNVALMASRPVPPQPVVVQPPPVLPPPNQSPICAMSVTPVKAFCGEIIAVDAGTSTDSDGKVVGMNIAFVDAQGQVVGEQVVDGSLAATVAMPCGKNTLRVTVVDDAGAVGDSAACSTTVEGMKRFRPVADVGYFRQYDPADYLFGRVGLEYRLSEEFSILGMVGAAPLFRGRDGRSAGLIDLFGEYSFAERYFTHFGVGAWLTNGDSDNDLEDSQLDLIVGVGRRVFGESEGLNGSLFFEVRSAPDELDGLYDFGRFGIGLRLRF